MKLLASLLAVVALFAASSNAFVAPPAAAASRKANAQPLAAKKDGMAEATAAFQATFPEFGKIGRYYAAESMLVLNEETGEYDAAATPSYGTDTLKDFFKKVSVEGLAGQELGDQAVFNIKGE